MQFWLKIFFVSTKFCDLYGTGLRDPNILHRDFQVHCAHVYHLKLVVLKFGILNNR